MKYIKFKRDHVRSGYKEGDVVAVRSKVPPDLELYVTEVQESTYREHQKKRDLERIEREEAELVNQIEANKAVSDAKGNAERPQNPVHEVAGHEAAETKKARNKG
jgi:hypothetical protein